MNWPDSKHSVPTTRFPPAIAKELLFNEHAAITDVAALEDAKKSLSRMLEARDLDDVQSRMTGVVCLFLAWSSTTQQPQDPTPIDVLIPYTSSRVS